MVLGIPPVRLVSPPRAALKSTPNLEHHLSLIHKDSTVKEVPSSLPIVAAEVEKSSLSLKPLEQTLVEGCRGGCPAPVCE